MELSAPPPRLRGLDHRHRIIDIATQLIAEGGIEALKARPLAQLAGVSVGTIYNSFSDLDALLFHVNAQTYDRLLVVLQAHQASADAARTDETDAVDDLLHLCRCYLNFVTANAPTWTAVLVFNRRQKTGVPDWYRARERALFDIARAAIARVPGGNAPETGDLAARALWAAIEGIVTGSVGRDGLAAHADEVWEQIVFVVETACRGLAQPALSRTQ